MLGLVSLQRYFKYLKIRAAAAAAAVIFFVFINIYDPCLQV
jgi:hypothetical protein